MPNASNAIVYLEQGQTLTDYTAMTDSGDRQIFTSSANVWSGKSGYAPIIRPNGIVTGRNVVTTAASGSDDVVDVSAFTAYSIGVLQTVSASTDESITRPVGDNAIVNSITMTSAGAIAVVVGTEGGSATFSETRGAAGGPPLIPVDSVELGQVRIAASASAAITSSEIFQIVGQHTERADFPAWDVNNIGDGQAADTSAETNAHIKFASVNPASHTGPIARKVYIRYYEPTFAEMSKTLDFQPAENSHTVTSTQYYNGTVGSKSTTLGQAQFTALLTDGVLDSVIADKDEVLTVKFLPDRDKTPYILTQGTIGLARTFPVSDQIQTTVTVTAEESSAEFSS